MKRLIPFLFLAFATIQAHGQEVERIYPCQMCSDNEDYIYEIGYSESAKADNAKRGAYIAAVAIISTRADTFVKIDDDNHISIKNVGPKPLSLSDTFVGSLSKLTQTCSFQISNLKTYVSFLNGDWLLFASTYSDLEVVCNEVYKDDDIYLGFCCVRIKRDKLKKMMEDWYSLILEDRP